MNFGALSPYVVLLVLFTFLFIFRKRLKLFVFRKIFGKFSPQFVKYYRTVADNNPYPRATKSEIIEHIGILRNLTEITQCQTTLSISFAKYSKGKKEIDILKDIGEPDYFTLRELGRYAIQIFGYDVSVFDKNAIALYFVYRKTLFMGEYIISREGQSVALEEVFGPLLAKYCPEYTYRSEDRLLLRDAAGTQILIMDDGFAVRLKYFNFQDNDILDKLFAEQEKIRNNFQSNLFRESVEV